MRYGRFFKMATFCIIILIWSFSIAPLKAVRLGSVPSFLEVSKVIIIQEGEDFYRVKCPVIPINSSEKIRISKMNVIWILHSAHVVIGGGSKELVDTYKNYNHQKYEYIVDTGELQINNISSRDFGVYRCIVELAAFTGDESVTHYFYQTAAVELASNDYINEEAGEFKGDIVRGLLTAIGTLLFFTIGCIVYSYRWKEPSSIALKKGNRSCQGGGDNEDCYQNWEASFEESKSSSEKDNVTYNVSDSDFGDNPPKISEKIPNTPPPSASRSDKKIFIISSSEQPQNHASSLLSPDYTMDDVATAIPPPETSPTFPESILTTKKNIEKEKQDGISIPQSPCTNNLPPKNPIPLFQFESTTCSTLTGSKDSCQRKLTKQQWLWNWTDSNISSETSITNQDSIAVRTMQKLVATPVIASPASEYSTISTISSSLGRDHTSMSFGAPVEMQSNL